MTDNTFRYAMIAICLFFMPFGAYYRYHSYTGEKIDRRQEGMVILVGLRLCGVVLFAAALAWMIDPELMKWSAMPVPVWLRWVAVVVAVGCGLLWVWAVSHLGKNLTDTVITRKEATLVTTGPYCCIRHPFYTSAIVGMISSSLIMTNWFILLFGSIACFAFLIPRTRIEESKLLERFGDDYRDLMQRTGRFFPRIGK
jgi:protein-S-isoprenylcysteine O-methyltransferase Ste14